MRVFSKVAKNSLDGCLGQISHLPIARASADVVATTSLVDGLMKTLVPPELNYRFSYYNALTSSTGLPCRRDSSGTQQLCIASL